MKNQIKIEGEEWKDVSGYEGFYQISNFGRVKSLPRVVYQKTNNNKPYSVKGGILKAGKNIWGYKQASFVIEGSKVYKPTIHRLVATNFIPNPNNLPDINHIDEDKSNNHYSNLEWCTERANTVFSCKKNTSSRHPGVCWHKRNKKWQVRVYINRKSIHIGYFKNELGAAQAYVDFCNANNLEFLTDSQKN